MPGYSEDKAGYLRRLRRIEGQVRGLQRMVENDDYCIDILTQISAATKALQAVSLGLIEQHLGHCVSEAITEGGESEQSLTPTRMLDFLGGAFHDLLAGCF